MALAAVLCAPSAAARAATRAGRCRARCPARSTCRANRRVGRAAPLAAAASPPPPPDAAAAARDRAVLPLLAAALLLIAAEPASAAALADAGASPDAHATRLWDLAETDPDFWVNMQRYARFALTTSVGMFYTVAKPLYDLLSKPKTAIPLVVGIFALTKLVTWTINAMLGLDPDIAF